MNTSEVELSRPLPVQVFLTVSLSIVMLVAIGGNLMVFLAVSRNTSLRTQVANTFIVNLALTDFGCSVLVMPFSLVSMWHSHWVFSSFWCDAVCFFNYCFIITSMSTLALISVDRYIYVIYPLRYDVIMSRGRAMALALSTWAVAVAFAVPPSSLDWVQYDNYEIICAIDWETGDFGTSAIVYTTTAFVICFLTPAAVMVYSYWGVFKVARRHAARVLPVIHMTEQARPATGVRREESPWSVTAGTDTQQTNRDRQESRHGSLASSSSSGSRERKQVTKAVKPILTMVVIYVVCNTPFSLTKLIKVVMAGNQTVPSYVSTLASWMAFLNPACNPMIYSIMRKDYQRVFWGFLPKSLQRYRRRDSEQGPTRKATGLAVAVSGTP
ncbi:beta-2 adrenergic receptor-like [Acanthaster planci]|uniref:Beta-2 adrenergic receptor-like n=1 Tax=Acanthaster planci TaxID=133434 RepID=A0A8B7XIA9_ACAPL|nr:beta-2 adrenergic receptor-like [Acanthaster planci]XP_022080526.1 beta-2 adrenergic receptor-like [Acanthaster planci]XP_022080528.1 beta-2 adrenergic receptor-like [Acanthaster planci]XP_022080529.1 beta-2 adrenergic receptor-like [Acanthaster planci]XP_022080530.1 beta-2 adrenergic receptor-like [Acanthaster planci]XP_022080531.1 beta-2 adrenergic receptor-like [Acanthaster planci]